MILVSSWSRIFVVTAVVMLFIGTTIGMVYMLHLSSININGIVLLPLHREMQTGAVTLLVMGVMYMLIPRIRSIQFKHLLETRVSFILMLCSIAMNALIMQVGLYSINSIAYMVRLAALTVFAYAIFSMLRVAPRVGRLSDYYFTLAVVMLIAYNTLIALDYTMDNLNRVYIWLSSIIYVIFGVQYKTVPVFFGRAVPIKGYDRLAFALASTSAFLLLIQMQLYAYIVLLIASLLFAYSIYVMSRYRIPEFLYTSADPQADEKIARLRFFIPLLRISYIMLASGLLNAILYSIMPTLSLYDLAIHLITIGFIGVTIMNFLPIMLPPIVGRSINYTRFSILPLILLIIGIGMRVAWNMPLEGIRTMLGASGLIVLASMLLYVRMIHASMDPID